MNSSLFSLILHYEIQPCHFYSLQDKRHKVLAAKDDKPGYLQCITAARNARPFLCKVRDWHRDVSADRELGVTGIFLHLSRKNGYNYFILSV